MKNTILSNQQIEHIKSSKEMIGVEFQVWRYPDTSVMQFVGKVISAATLDDDHEGILLGEVAGFFYRHVSSGDFLEQVDQIDQDSSDLAWAANCFNELVEEDLTDDFMHHMLGITKVIVKPEFRGMLLGYNAVMEAINAFGDEAGVVVKPYPIPSDKRPYTKEGHEKLKNYWANFGFRPMEFDETIFYHNTALRWPEGSWSDENDYYKGVWPV